MDFGVICGLLLLNAAVGFIQEYQAGSIVEELKKTLALKSVVLRNGSHVEIEAFEIVPGDLLHLDEVSSLRRLMTFQGCSVLTYFLAGNHTVSGWSHRH